MKLPELVRRTAVLTTLLASILAAAPAFAAPPALTITGNQPVREGATLNIALSGSDSDPGDSVSFSATGLPVFCSLTNGPANNSGSIQCTPAGIHAGTYPVRVTATDSSLLAESTFEDINIDVIENTPPNLTNIGNQAVVEGASLNIPLSATDADGDGLRFSFTSVPAAGGFCTLTDGGNGSGSIDCNPIVGNGGGYAITVTVTDNGPVPASASDLFTLTVGANQPPTATDVNVSGVPALGELLTGVYKYDDADPDEEGASTFRWLRDGIAIPGANTVAYEVVAADLETALRFEVTPVALTGVLQGLPVQSADFQISNSPPSITGQVVIDIPEDSSREIVLVDLTVTDSDSDVFTVTVRDGANYTRSGLNGNTIT
ncbi:MAG: putative Ig domain-containing protein, partial [Woeseiaceae bacterium]|nr:putative Ig domain-containing protein [Woeseiaceae bacterium]